jgi:hypothetical protein
MYNISQKDYYCLLNLLDAIDKIRQYSAPFATADDFNDAAQAFETSERIDKLKPELKNIS